VSAEFGYGLAFATGVSGAFHCLGMCSGINGGLFVCHGRFPALLPVLSFHAARIGTYAVLGVSGAVLGRVLVQTGIVGKTQGILMILAGVLIIALGLRYLVRGAPGAQREVRVALPSLPSHKRARAMPLIGGLLNGLVPCSLVFSVALQAAATADPLQAALLMLSFGAGTLPVLVALSLLGALIGARVRGAMARLAGVGVVLLGLWTLYEGLVFYDIIRGLANW
jgi:sulfite exporter TauE/SafE